MEEAFWNTEGGGKEIANNGTDAPSSSSESSPHATEHVIEGSPLMMIGGLVLFVVMAASLLSDALGDGVDYTFETVAFSVVALVLPLYGYAQYKKTVIISWKQEQRLVEVFKGFRNSEERNTMLSYTAEPGDQIILQSETTHSGGRRSIDHDYTDSKTEYWLAIRRKDGTYVESSDTATSTFFLKRIKQHLDQLQ